MITDRHSDLILNMNPDIVVIVNSKAIIEFVNKAGTKLLGIKEKEIIGKSALQMNFISTKSKIKIGKEVASSVGGNDKSKIYDVEIKNKKGEWKIFELKSETIKEKGEIKGWVVVLRDKTKERKKEEKLTIENTEYKTLINATDLVIAKVDTKLRYTLVNNTGLRMLHTTEKEIIGKKIKDFFPKPYAKQMENAFKKVIRTKKKVRKSDVIPMSGKEIWFDTNLEPIKDNKGNVKEVLAVIHDITEEKEIEEYTKKQKELAELYLNTAGTMIVVLDNKGNIIKINKKGYELLEYKEGELKDKQWVKNCIPKEKRKEVKKIFEEITSKKNEWKRYERVKGEVITKSGKIKKIFWSNNILTDENKKIIGTISSGEDLTDISIAEQKLKESEEFLNSVVENIPAMIFAKEAKELKFKLLNKAGEFYFGKDDEEVIGKSDYDFFPKKQADFFVKKDREVLESKEMLEIPEEPIRTKEGERILHTKKIPILDEKGNPKYLLGISEDITKQKELVKKMQDSLDELNKFNQFAVGREMKMIELKKEINELRMQRNNQKRKESR